MALKIFKSPSPMWGFLFAVKELICAILIRSTYNCWLGIHQLLALPILIIWRADHMESVDDKQPMFLATNLTPSLQRHTVWCKNLERTQLNIDH